MITKEFIAHRVNTIEELNSLPKEFGVELDLRDENGRVIIAHDPFIDGEKFEDYLKYYNHGTMILNIKSERIEHKVLDLINKYQVRRYFFLDSSIPMVIKLSDVGEFNIAVRFSEYEPIESVLALKNRVKWVWVDCFSKLPIDYVSFKKLKDEGFNLCLVSPELQGRVEDIEIYKSYLQKNNICFEAICTKVTNVSKWR